MNTIPYRVVKVDEHTYVPKIYLERGDGNPGSFCVVGDPMPPPWSEAKVGDIVHLPAGPNEGLDEGENDKVYQLSKSIRQYDAAMMDVFKQIAVLGADGKAHAVPIIWSSDRRSEAIVDKVLQKSESTNIDKINLPLLNIWNTGLSGPEGGLKIHYTLTARTLYREDMNQIIEQVLIKFSPTHKIDVGTCKLDSMANNEDIKTEKALVVNKWQFNMTLEVAK